MTVQLFLAPAGYGKSEYALQEVRAAAQGLQDTPRVCLATPLQVDSWRRRLAAKGGALGVRLLTFDRLYATLLNRARESYTELDDPVKYRLLRAVVADCSLPHHGVLSGRPGFIEAMRALVRELKGALIRPEDFLEATEDEGRLHELATIYRQYQERLGERMWADRAGLGWLAVEALAQRATEVAKDWSLLVVDGFDSFTETQLALLAVLAGRVERMVITLTGEALSTRERPRPVYRRFLRTRRQLEEKLGVEARPLPHMKQPAMPILAELEASLFAPGEGVGRRQVLMRSGIEAAAAREGAGSQEDSGAITLVAAPDRASEVRAALQWLKERLVRDGAEVTEVALLARDLTPYRPYILQTAAEFGIPLRPVDGLPLRQNPAVTALLTLLRLMLPAEGAGEGPALGRREVIAAWRSPYFDWTTAYVSPDDAEPIGIGPGDAELLDAVALQGRVIGGHDQWLEVLEVLEAQGARERPLARESREWAVPFASEAAGAGLPGKFLRFLRRLLPLPVSATYREHVAHLEALIGPDSEVEAESGVETVPTHLNVIDCVDRGDEETARRDREALRTLKKVLRGIVWAEEIVGEGEDVPFARFFEELAGAVEATTYRPPQPGRSGVLVADVIAARGIPFRAVAVLGLAEGEFPAALREDPFLRDEDRKRLREEHNLQLEPSTESRERETFYETVTRPWQKLLLTRPRLADSGAPWPASPYWEEVARRSGVKEEQVSSRHVPQPEEAASWPELLAGLVVHAEETAAARWVGAQAGNRWQRLLQAANLFEHRYRSRRPSVFDGDLSPLRGELAERYGPTHVWSPSRLESYRTCPFFFFVGHVLELEPRLEPVEGLDARQLGNLYHRILEATYQAVPARLRTDAVALKEALPTVAKPILDAAPKEEGFRATAWWDQTRREILEKVRHSLEALSKQAGKFVPVRFEVGFFGARSLKIERDGVSFRLHGLIDRVDRAPEGEIRIVDYKTAGPYTYGPDTLDRGEKLQLPLYALAAQEALGLGSVTDGFYWHVQHAEASGLQLAEYGVDEAVKTAVAFAGEAVTRVRQGDFHPTPPAGGCPAYCPAASFCWQYEARRSW